MSSQSALTLIGGRDEIILRVRSAVAAGRLRSGLTPAELASMSGYADEETICRLESGVVAKGTVHEILAILYCLGISLDDVLPLPPLSDSELDYWANEMRSHQSGVLAAAGGAHHSRRRAIALFIRLQAIQQL